MSRNKNNNHHHHHPHHILTVYVADRKTTNDYCFLTVCLDLTLGLVCLAFCRSAKASYTHFACFVVSSRRPLRKELVKPYWMQIMYYIYLGDLTFYVVFECGVLLLLLWFSVDVLFVSWCIVVLIYILVLWGWETYTRGIFVNHSWANIM